MGFGEQPSYPVERVAFSSAQVCPDSGDPYATSYPERPARYDPTNLVSPLGARVSDIPNHGPPQVWAYPENASDTPTPNYDAPDPTARQHLEHPPNHQPRQYRLSPQDSQCYTCNQNNPILCQINAGRDHLTQKPPTSPAIPEQLLHQLPQEPRPTAEPT